MIDGFFIFFFVVFFGERDSDDLWSFDVEYVLECDEAVGIFGVEAEEVEEGHGGVEHFDVFLLYELLTCLEGVFLLDFGRFEDGVQGEEGCTADCCA